MNACPDCNKPIRPKSIRCRSCSAKSRTTTSNPTWNGGRKINSKGYVLLSKRHFHPNADVRGDLREHVLVMSQMLGRPLLPGEEVHHKNGVRHDNERNLELWVVSQHKGQRVNDLIEWAVSILERYAPERLK
jgi:hypothetical protein